MRLPSFRRHAPATPNLTPMVDVVFQLIVFFVATSTLAKYEFARGITLPEARSGEPVATTRSMVTVNVLPDGTLLAAGRTVTAAEVEKSLRVKAQQVGAEQVSLYIRADASTRYGAVEPVLLAAARAGVWRVRIAVREADQRGSGTGR